MDEARNPGMSGDGSFGGAHEYRETPVDAREVEAVTEEELAQFSPDGRQPDTRSRGRGRTIFLVILAVGLPLVAVAVISIGGPAALLMGGVYLLVFAAAAFPVWYAGLMRKREESEATEIVTHALREKKEKGQAA